MLRPTREDLLAAAGGAVPDVIAPDLRVLFCGINPSLYTAAVGRHFARPGNRFWRALDEAGFTDRRLAPSEDRRLLDVGLGITNLVARATAAAADLSDEELAEGARELARKVRRCRPGYLAVLGITAYRVAFGHPRAEVGPQAETIGSTPIWVLPNPSGINAHYPPKKLAQEFHTLRTAAFPEGAGQQG